MENRLRNAWLLRRAGFGASDASELDEPTNELFERLVNPDGRNVPAATDPWDDALLGAVGGANGLQPTADARRGAIDGWLVRMVTTPRPLEERMAWIWHDHFATSLDKVKSPVLMVNHLRTIQRHAMGSFPALVKAMTIDAAMLLWLDGNTSTAAAPNENFGRELLELFTVGLGAHSEADVQAAARALTGWRVQRSTNEVALQRRLHDEAPQVLLGRSGVNDVDTVVDAVCSAPGCAPFVTRSLAGHLLGPAAAADEGLIAKLAADFRRGGLEIRPLVRALLAAGLERRDTAVVEAPVPWLVRAQRMTGAQLPAAGRVAGLTSCGQVPMRPPDVGGWPAHTAWLASSTVVARATLAATVAAATPPTSAARDAARRGDFDGLAAALGRAVPFGPATVAALRSVPNEVGALALALTAPDQVVI